MVETLRTSKNLRREYAREYSRNRTKRLVKAGQSNQERRISDRQKDEVSINNEVTIVYPFSSSISKNVVWGRGQFSNRVFMRDEAKKNKEAIALLIQQEARKKGIKFVDGKIYIDIFVQKNNPNADALNVIDLVADAVSLGTGVNDKWFCIKSVDWEFKKDNPMMFIEVIQEVETPQQLCSFCGFIGPKSQFKYLRQCLDCTNLSKQI